MKRCLGLILALLMLLSLYVPAWAEGPADTENAVPAIFDDLVERLRANPRSLVFTEGTDERILEAAARLKQDGFLTPHPCSLAMRTRSRRRQTRVAST